MTRHARTFCALALSCGVPLATAHGFGTPAEAVAQQVPPELVAARAAVGTPAALGAVKSLVLEGTIQNINHNIGKLAPEEPLEIRILLPDHYLRIARGSRSIRTQGFRGTSVLNGARPVQNVPFTSSAPTPGALDVERANLARLVLGMLGHTATALPITVRPVAPHADMRTLEATGPNGFTALLDLAKVSHVSLQVRFSDQVSFPVEGGTERRVGNARVGSMPPRVDAEVALMFEERRPVDGLNLPHRIRRVARDVTFEDIRLKKIVVNPPLTAKDFER